MSSLVIRSSRLKYALLLLVSLAFVGTGVLLIARKGFEQAGWGAWASMLFFGAGALVFAWQLVDLRPRLVFDSAGVLDRTLGVGVIPWTEIDGAYLVSINGSAFLCLELRQPQRWIERLGPLRRALVAGNEKLGLTPLSLNLSGIAGDPHEIHTYVLTMAAASRVPDAG